MSLTTPVYTETNLVGRIVNTSVTTTATTIYVQFTDSKLGTAREPQATTLYFVIDKDNERFEIIKCDSHSTTDGVTTLTVNAAGRAMPLFGIGAGGATGKTHPISSQVGCVDVHWYTDVLNNIIVGDEGTTGTSFKIGAETNVDITLYAWNGDANEPFIMYDASENKWVFSNDGTTTTDVGGGTGTITAGDGIDIVAGVVSTDIKANSGLEISATELAVKLVADGGISVGAAGLVLDLTDASYTAGPLATVISDVTATMDEINQALDGISANVTDTNLNTLTAGPTSDATALHGHTGQGLVSYTASEAIIEGARVSKTTTADEVENTVLSIWYTDGTDYAADENAAATLTATCSPDDDKVAMAYLRGTTVYCVVGTVVNKVITWGTPVTVQASSGTYIRIAKLDTDKIVVAYRSSAGNLAAIVATISGTVPTFGSAVTMGTVDANRGSIGLAATDTDEFVIGYGNQADGDQGYAVCGAVTGTVIDNGSAVEFESGAVKYCAAAKSASNKCVIYYQDDDDGDKCKLVDITITGTNTVNLTAGPTEVNANACTYIGACQLADDYTMAVFYDGTDTEMNAVAYRTSTAALGTEVVVRDAAGNTAPSNCVAISATEALAVYSNGGNVRFKRITVSGTTLTPITDATATTDHEYAVGSTTSGATHIVDATLINSTTSKVVVVYDDSLNSNYASGHVRQNYRNTDSFVGFADAAAAAAASVNVRRQGVVTVSETLVAGTKYYLDDSATAGAGLSSTNSSGIEVGIANDTDELDVEIKYAPVVEAKELINGLNSTGTEYYRDLLYRPKWIEVKAASTNQGIGLGTFLSTAGWSVWENDTGAAVVAAGTTAALKAGLDAANYWSCQPQIYDDGLKITATETGAAAALDVGIVIHF